MIGRHPFAAWVLVGILIGFALTPLFVITLPLAIVCVIVVRRRTREPGAGRVTMFNQLFLDVVARPIVRVGGAAAEEKKGGKEAKEAKEHQTDLAMLAALIHAHAARMEALQKMLDKEEEAAVRSDSQELYDKLFK